MSEPSAASTLREWWLCGECLHLIQNDEEAHDFMIWTVVKSIQNLSCIRGETPLETLDFIKGLVEKGILDMME